MVDQLCDWCSLEEAVLFPGGEDDSVDLANGLTGTVVIAGVPLGDGVSHVGLDFLAMGEESLTGLDLPVGVGVGGLNLILLEVVGVMDIDVLGVVDTCIGVIESHSLVTLDGAHNGRPLLGLDGSNESVGIVGHLLVRLEAGVDGGSEVGTVVTVEETSLEVGGGGGGNSRVLGGESESSEHIVL